MKKISWLGLALSLLMVSCGEGQKESEKEVTKETKQEKGEETPQSIDLEISGTDDMKFDKKILKAKAGQEVTVTLIHAGKMTKEQMGHNWCLLQPGINMADFNEKAYEAGLENNHIPLEGDWVIAYTEVIGGGEKTSVTFTAPEPGKYTFVCSFPGHSGMMKGNFLVD